MKIILKIIITVSGCLLLSHMQAQDTIRYTGKTLSNVDYHHGQLPPAIGVHNIQIMRAGRKNPDSTNGFGWTYNHAPMIAYWNNTFFVEYLSNPVGEHVPPGQTLLLRSKDGYTWSNPIIIFPPLKIPDGFVKEGYPGVAKDLYAVNHQRMGFYVSAKKRFFALAYYGIAMDAKDDPNDGKGIGRVIREIHTDGSFGAIHFIRYNASWKQREGYYPFYTASRDKGFVEACNEILARPLIMQQWVEEADRNDPLIPLKKEVKAMSYYHLPDGRVVALWKNALTSMSKDDGKTWQYNPLRAPGFVNSNAKIWGQKTGDGNYATVYNPSEFRWPLAISTSKNGLEYTNLLLVNGEITSMRFGGNYKSYGPQYVRGILEGNGTPPDGKLWVTYSMNKEDIWVSSIPVPVKDKAEEHANDAFGQMPEGRELQNWNIYSPLRARVKVEAKDGSRVLALHDADKFDYARAERVVPASKKMVVSFTVIPMQQDGGNLEIEFQNASGLAGIRLTFDSAGSFKTKAGYRYRELTKYRAGEAYDIRLELNTENRFFTVSINGKNAGNNLFFAPLESVERIVFRTGGVRRFPDADTPTDQMYDLPGADEPIPESVYYIKSLQTGNQ